MGQLAAARYDHAMAYDSDLQAHRHVRRPRGGERSALRRPVGVGLRPPATGASARRAGAATALPYDRSGHAMVYDPVRKKTIMFSGWQPGAGFYSPRIVGVGRQRADLDRSTRWSRARRRRRASAPSMVWDSGRNRAILFGGIDDTGRLNDIWEWDGTPHVDRPDAASGTKPSPAPRRDDRLRRRAAGRRCSTAATPAAASARRGDRRHLGRRDLGVGRHRGTWTKITAPSPSGTHVLLRLLPTWSYDASARQDRRATTTATSIWEYNPATPALDGGPTTTPTKVDTALAALLSRAAIVYDSAAQKLVLFGGQYGSTPRSGS